MRRLVVCALALVAVGCSGPVSFPANGGNWPAPTIQPFVHQARFAITDNLSDELSYIDPVQPVLLGNVPVGDVPVELEGPHHIAASPDGKYIYYNLSNYVPGTGTGPHGAHGTGTVPGSVVKLDAVTNEKVGEVLVDRSPGDVILSQDGKTAYVSHYDLLRLQSALLSGMGLPDSTYSDVAIVDTDTMTRLAMIPVCPTAHGEGLSLDGKTLYVTCAGSDELAVLDVTDRAHPTVTTRVTVGPTPGKLGTPSYSPYALAVSPVDGTVWVSDNQSADVRVFDPATMMMDGSKVVNVDGVAMFGAFSADGKTIYVPHQQASDELHAIDVATLQERPLLLPTSACLNAHAFALGPDGVNGIVVCEGDHVKRSGSVVFVNTAAFAVTGFVNTGMFSDGAAWLPPM
jgi:DNA-binding beta-propeller fold protein YncE